MPSNLILPFAQGGGALVQTQAVYAVDAQRGNGNQPGVARADFVNKCLKQVSAMAVGLAQFLTDNQASDVTDDLLGAALSTMITNAVKAAAQSPAGTIVWIPGTSPLPNTVKVNGALLSRATYSRLYTFGNTSGNMAASDGAWLSGQFSPGDGSTTFRIPDLRGYMMRAWDDARGINSGRAIGSVELDQLLQHNHGVTDAGHGHPVTDPGHGHGVSDPSHVHNIQHVADSANSGGGISGNIASGGQNWSTDGSFTGIGIAGAASGITVGVTAAGITIQNSSGGTEVRVKNIALMPVIYY
jgi:microcystin-dependent protein